MRRWLLMQGFRTSLTKEERAEGVVLSPADRVLTDVETNRTVDFVGEIAGYKTGLHTIGGRRVLCPREAELIEPQCAGDGWQYAERQALFDGVGVPEAQLAESEKAWRRVVDESEPAAEGWPIISRFLTNLFVSPPDEHGERLSQLGIVFGWWRDFLQAVYRGVDTRYGPPKSPALFMAGEWNCGKTRFTEMLRITTGRRRGFPYKWMTGESGFNKDLFQSPLLLVDDEADKTDIKSRAYLAQITKQLVVGSAGRCEGKGTDALELDPLWRVVMVCNVDQDSLRVLPPMDMIHDKCVVLKGYRADMPMPTTTTAQQRLFWKAVMYELPFFVDWLLNRFELPEKYGPTNRFPVIPWHHPEIVDLMDELTPWAELWALLEATILKPTRQNSFNRMEMPSQCWAGTCQDLIEVFRTNKEEWNLTQMEINRMSAAWFGRHLKAIESRYPERAYMKRYSSKRIWYLSQNSNVHARDELVETVGK
ncbi:MAG: DUF5906 domain-containing protein [Verrucomicrobiota bacterium]